MSEGQSPQRKGQGPRAKRTGVGGKKQAPRRKSDAPASRAGARKRTGGGGAGKGRDKRTSRNSDDRNPTKSGTQYPSRKFRRAGEEAPAPAARKSSLRKVEPGHHEPSRKVRARKVRERKVAPTRRRRNPKTTEATEELARLAGRNARGAQMQLARAAEAYEAGRERDAARLLRPLRDAYPDASAVRELLGLCQYRLGNYAAAAKELEEFVALTDSVEQHPVLMDCMRAMGKYRRVDELWEELAAASPTNALVIEGRIVLAGARADRGRVRDAIALLDRRAGDVQRVQEHHLRLWYALADLYERAGEVARARDLFSRIRRHDASFADVAERLAALK